jgi:ribonuclease P protein component
VPADPSLPPVGARAAQSSLPELSRLVVADLAVLPRTARMRRSDDFRSTVRTGVRAGRPTVVVHAVRSQMFDELKVGVVVSKAVGNAVTRNRTKRRLRHLVLNLMASTPRGHRLVVRALPVAASPTADLAGDLTKAWGRALARVKRDEIGLSSGSVATAARARS